MASERPADLVLRAARAVVLAPNGEVERPAAVAIRDGRVLAVLPPTARFPAVRDHRLPDDAVLLPGLVDSHVHLQDPGRDGWEGFASGTRAAAAAGVTTLVDMPLDSLPVTTTPAALAAKRAAAAGRTRVDVRFWAGAVPGNLGRLGDLVAQGCVGVKAYLSDSGLAEFPPLSPAELRRALTELAATGTVLAVHAEDPAAVAAGAADTELPAVRTLVSAVRQTGGRAHVVHLSSADAADVVARARAEGLAITAETCPHYLTLTDEELPPGACSPPVRDAANRDRLWEHLCAGTLDAVVSDHSPSPGDVPGIASLQLAPAVTWTAMRARGLPLTDLARWCGRAPADLVGLADRGRIAPGAAADLCVFAPDRTFTVARAALHQRQTRTPYTGRTLAGVVVETWREGVRLGPET